MATRSDQLLVTSFDPAVVSRVHRLAPTLPVGQLLFDPDPSMDVLVGLQAAYGHDAVNPWDPLVDAPRGRLRPRARAWPCTSGPSTTPTAWPSWSAWAWTASSPTGPTVARAVVDRSVADLG